MTWRVLLLLLSLLSTACGVTIESQGVKALYEARSSRRTVHFQMSGADGALSMGAIGAAQYGARSAVAVSQGHVMNGAAHAEVASRDLAFQLRKLGFRLVDDPNGASYRCEFSIGTVRYDLLAGWIADQAFLEFFDVRSGELVASYRARGQAITPTVNRIITKLGDRVAQHMQMLEMGQPEHAP